MLTQDTWRPKEQTKSWQHQVAWLAAKGLHRLTKFTARRLLRLWTAHVVKCFHYSVSSFCIHQQQKAPSCTLVFRYSLSPISAVKLIWGRIESNGRKDHLLYLTVPPSPPPPPPVSVSLSYHWLAAGLTTRFGQCVVSTGCLSPPREPSKPMNRTQWMKAWGYWWLPPNLTQVLCGLHSGASFSGLCLVYCVGLIALNLWHIAHYSF